MSVSLLSLSFPSLTHPQGTWEIGGDVVINMPTEIKQDTTFSGNFELGERGTLILPVGTRILVKNCTKVNGTIKVIDFPMEYIGQSESSAKVKKIFSLFPTHVPNSPNRRSI